jgi:hypothetical protein
MSHVIDVSLGPRAFDFVMISAFTLQPNFGFHLPLDRQSIPDCLHAQGSASAFVLTTRRARLRGTSASPMNDPVKKICLTP